MALTYRESIINHLKTLSHHEGVQIESSDKEKTLTINYRTVQSMSFKFVWKEDHFIGYFVDRDSDASQAVVSLWTPLEASHFVSSYATLLDLRAGRPSPL